MSLLLALLLLGPGPTPAADAPAALTVRIEDPGDPGSAMTFTVVRGTEIHLLPSGTVVVRIPGTWEVSTGVPAEAPVERHAAAPGPSLAPGETAVADPPVPEGPPAGETDASAPPEEQLPPLPEGLTWIDG